MCHSIFRLPYPQLAHGASGSLDLAGLTRGERPRLLRDRGGQTCSNAHCSNGDNGDTATDGTGTVTHVAAISSSHIESLFDIILKRKKMLA